MQRHFSDSDYCKDIIPEFFKTRYFYAIKTVNFFAEEPRARLVSSAKIGVKLGNKLADSFLAMHAKLGLLLDNTQEKNKLEQNR